LKEKSQPDRCASWTDTLRYLKRTKKSPPVPMKYNGTTIDLLRKKRKGLSKESPPNVAIIPSQTIVRLPSSPAEILHYTKAGTQPKGTEYFQKGFQIEELHGHILQCPIPSYASRNPYSCCQDKGTHPTDTSVHDHHNNNNGI